MIPHMPGPSRAAAQWYKKRRLSSGFLPYPIDHKPTKMSSRSISFADTSRLNSPEANRNPTFHRAVERAAVYMCRQAIKAGKLRVVAPARPTTQFTPRMDLLDDHSSSNVTAIFEVPGVKTSDIALRILEGSLVITGKRQATYSVPTSLPLPSNPISAADALARGEGDADTAAPQSILRVQELRYGTFHRSIPMPEGIKESEVTAGLQDGMLTVTWPRSPARSSHHATTPPPLETAAAS